MKQAHAKTNALRSLDTAKIAYATFFYEAEDGAIDGISVAAKVGLPMEEVFKTLVAIGASKTVCVFVIPVASELDLKLAARAAGEKSIALLPVAQLLATTGYVRGGCSPIGMKKRYHTYFDQSLRLLSTVTVSAGRIGTQVRLSPADLLSVTSGQTAELCR